MAKWTLPDMIPRTEADRMVQEAVAAAMMEAAEIALSIARQETGPLLKRRLSGSGVAIAGSARRRAAVRIAAKIRALIPAPALAALEARDARVREACAKRVDAFADEIMDGANACRDTHPDFAADREEHADDARQVAAAIREGGK